VEAWVDSAWSQGLAWVVVVVAPVSAEAWAEAEAWVAPVSAEA